jgi:hypothetical protein
VLVVLALHQQSHAFDKIFRSATSTPFTFVNASDSERRIFFSAKASATSSMKKILLFITAILAATISSAQWTRITAIHPQNIRAIAVLGDTILTTSESRFLYRSRDGGVTWDSLTVSNNAININCLKVIDEKIFVGTSAGNGIFTSDDFGASWTNTGQGLFTISDFVKHDNEIYASTLGNGVYKFNQQQNNWILFNDSLPSYSVNVNTMANTTNSLLIAAGSNGTFYRYNFGINGWNEEFYDGHLHPGLQINRLINNFDTLFAVSGNRIIRSDDDGLNWTNDNFGTHNGTYRIFTIGSVNHYTFTNVTTGVWIQERNKYAVSGTSWAPNQNFISLGFAFDILESENNLYLGMLDGLYVKSLTTKVNENKPDDCSIQIFTNPPDISGTRITSDCNIKSYSLTNVTGQLFSSASIMSDEFFLQNDLAPGIYFLTLNFQDNTIVKKIMIQ